MVDYGPTPTVATETFQAEYIDEGDTIDFTNGGTAVKAGQIVMFGVQPMFAPHATPASVKGTLKTRGRLRVKKDTSTIVVGDAIYWHTTGSPVVGDASSGAANNVAVGGYLMGQATKSAATGVATVEVKLLENVNILRGSYPYATYGDVLSGGAPQGTREQSETQNYALGTKREYADGRRFRYIKARTALEPEFGAAYAAKTITQAVAPTQGSGIGLAAGYTVKITVGATDGLAGNGAIAADELVGGHVVIGNGSSEHPENRLIVGNTVVAANGGTSILTLDEPLVENAVGRGVETLMNRWILSDMNVTNSAYVTARGMPARRMTINYFGWAQTKGPCWITSNSNTCNSAGDRTLVFASNGSVVSSDDITVESGFQIAGKAIDMSGSSASNAPFVDLELES